MNTETQRSPVAAVLITSPAVAPILPVSALLAERTGLECLTIAIAPVAAVHPGEGDKLTGLGPMVAETNVAALVPAGAETNSSAEEDLLTQRIPVRWAEHVQKNAVAKRSRLELTGLCTQLAEDLYRLKKVYCEAGPRGRWSRFLASFGIARTSAERLVKLHAKSIGDETFGCASDTSTGTEEVTKLVAKIGGKLETLLATSELLDQFEREMEALIATMKTSLAPQDG